MPSPLEVRDLQADYGGNPVVNGVSLDLGAGELVTVVGSNGAGKTTLLKALAGLVPVRRGEVRLDGLDLLSSPAYQRARRGLILVPEGRRLFPELTVLENLRTGELARSGRGDLAADRGRVFDLFPVLGHKRGLLAASLSGGEQQMLAIARGLMGAPRILLIDEPSLGLSPLAAGSLFRALAVLAAAGLAIILAEQNVRLALRVATRGYVLRQGEVVFEGPAAALSNRPDLPELYLGTAVSEHAEDV